MTGAVVCSSVHVLTVLGWTLLLEKSICKHVVDGDNID